jgi:probable HAF family extracellular repeat protein
MRPGQVVMLIGLLMGPAVWAEPQYTLTDLGPIQVSSMNRQTLVAGSQLVAGVSQAVIWQQGLVQRLGTLGGNMSEAADLNDAGVVVGVAELADLSVHAFRWIATNGMVDLGTLGGPDPYSTATAINAPGIIVGASLVPDGTLETIHAVRWAGGSPIDLGTLGGRNSGATGINRWGWIVGQAETATGESHAALWVGRGVVDLGTLGGPMSGAYAINDTGVVVGFSWTAGYQAGSPPLAFRWTIARGLQALPSLPAPYVACSALAINRRGQIVGACDTERPFDLEPVHAVLWDPHGQVTDLNTLIEPNGWLLIGATGVNQAGHIVGLGTLAGQQRAWLLTPVSGSTALVTEQMR